MPSSGRHVVCEVFIRADPALYESRVHSVRLHGLTTSIRLENQFRDVPAAEGSLLRFI